MGKSKGVCRAQLTDNGMTFENRRGMRWIHSILSILMPIFTGIIPVRGNSYYFSTRDGDDTRSASQAQNPATPWRSLTKLNQVFAQLQPGDSVLFRRGEVYYGSIVVGASGAEGRPIVLAPYGQGYDPIISGFSRLTGWKAGSANGVWQAPCQGCGLRVNMVTVENVAQPMGVSEQRVSDDPDAQ